MVDRSALDFAQPHPFYLSGRFLAKIWMGCAGLNPELVKVVVGTVAPNLSIFTRLVWTLRLANE
jgi:hypothetical protein